MKKDYDAIIVGSGPNGLAAAIVLQQAGLSVLLIEGKETIGGGLRSSALTLPGYIHDICSAIHPFGAASPFFQSISLERFGYEAIFPKIPAAHPFDDGSAATLLHSVEETAASLGDDAAEYQRLMKPLLADWDKILPFVMKPGSFPSHPVAMAKFGLSGLQPVKTFVKKKFHNGNAQGLFAGMAAHSVMPLTNMATTAVALVFLLFGHTSGWPLARGGSQQMANALAAYLQELGGKIETGLYINSLGQLPSSDAVLFDVTPRQLITIAGDKFSSLYKWQLKRFRYSSGIFKVDWALDAPIPFIAPECRQAGTVHLGNSFDEIAEGEQLIASGKHSEKPFVLLTQSSVFDSSRAPVGKHTAWAYCHVPPSSTRDMTTVIENQVERFAPGFKKLILARHTMNSAQMEMYNPNYIGGDITGGAQDIGQLFTRPAIRFSPYSTSAKGIYICSASTSPGGGVHGMCGYHAAKKVLRDIFHLK